MKSPPVVPGIPGIPPERAQDEKRVSPACIPA